MNTIKVTATQFAELHKVDYAVASGVLRFLQSKGIATSSPLKVGKGKPSMLYDVPCQVTLDLNGNVKVQAPTAPVEPVPAQEAVA